MPGAPGQRTLSHQKFRLSILTPHQTRRCIRSLETSNSAFWKAVDRPRVLWIATWLPHPHRSSALAFWNPRLGCLVARACVDPGSVDQPRLARLTAANLTASQRWRSRYQSPVSSPPAHRQLEHPASGRNQAVRLTSVLSRVILCLVSISVSWTAGCHPEHLEGSI